MNKIHKLLSKEKKERTGQRHLSNGLDSELQVLVLHIESYYFLAFFSSQEVPNGQF